MPAGTAPPGPSRTGPDPSASRRCRPGSAPRADRRRGTRRTRCRRAPGRPHAEPLPPARSASRTSINGAPSSRSSRVITQRPRRRLDTEQGVRRTPKGLRPRCPLDPVVRRVRRDVEREAVRGQEGDEPRPPDRIRQVHREQRDARRGHDPHTPPVTGHRFPSSSSVYSSPSPSSYMPVRRASPIGSADRTAARSTVSSTARRALTATRCPRRRRRPRVRAHSCGPRPRPWRCTRSRAPTHRPDRRPRAPVRTTVHPRQG